MHTRSRICRLGSTLAVILTAWIATVEGQTTQTAVISGRIVDARTDEPLARVLVHVEHAPAFVETDGSGAFTVTLPPGKHVISASLIGYAAARHVVDVAAGASRELIIELSEGAGTYEEYVTVSGAMAQHEADTVPASAVLHGRDLQALRGVMLDDPLRAVLFAT